jgi:hypothetical protein
VDQLPRGVISVTEISPCSDANVTDNTDVMFCELGMVARPPILHGFFMFEMSDDEDSRDFLVANEVVEQ